LNDGGKRNVSSSFFPLGKSIENKGFNVDTPILDTIFLRFTPKKSLELTNFHQYTKRLFYNITLLWVKLSSPELTIKPKFIFDAAKYFIACFYNYCEICVNIKITDH